jgi:hypothetical protein
MDFDRLSPEEREVVGDPEDYDWAHPIVPPPAARERTQFSMRVEAALYAELLNSAQARGLRFSDVVREALEAYIGRGRKSVTGTAPAYSISGASIIVSSDPGGWSPTTRGVDPERLETKQVPPPHTVPSTTG